MTKRFHIRIQKGLFILILSALFPALSFAEGGGGGGVLQGVASIINASSPIFMAASNASSAKFQAQMSASTSIFQAQSAADVSRYQSDNLRDTTLYQTFVSAQVAESNNRYATQRLQMQLNETHDNFQQNLALSRDAYKTEMNYKFRNLALEEKKIDQQILLDKMKVKAAVVQAGFSSGIKDVQSAVAFNPNYAEPNKKLLSNVNQISALNPIEERRAIKGGFLARSIASGSTRAKRNVVSDLSSFKSTLGSRRSFASEAGLIRHSQNEDSSSSSPFKIHGHGHE